LPPLVEIAIGNTRARIRSEDEFIYGEVDKALSYFVKSALYQKPYKLYLKDKKAGRVPPRGWNGVAHLYEKRTTSFPAGLAPRIVKMLGRTHQVKVYDRRLRPEPHPKLVGGTLTGNPRDWQTEAFEAAMTHERGVFEAATGAGKTVLMAQLIAHLGQPTLVIVTRNTLAEQSVKRFAETIRFPFAASPFGIIGDGVWQPGLITVATYQTIAAMIRSDKKGMDEWLDQFTVLHVDEAHHAQARTLLAQAEFADGAYWRYGYCVTPETRILTQDLQWLPAGDLEVGADLVGFEEESRAHYPRRLSPSKVTYTGREMQHCYALHLSNGEVLKCSAEHPWLVYPYSRNKSTQWRTAETLSKCVLPVRIPRYVPLWAENQGADGGYVSGSFDGEGNRSLRNGRMRGLVFQQKENKMWQKVVDILTDKGFRFSTQIDKKGMRIAALPMHSMFRCLGEFRPPRLLDIWMRSEWPALYPVEILEIVAVEDIGWQEVVALSTSTKTYIAEGFGSHNSATPFKGEKETELRLVGMCGEIIHSYKAAQAIEDGIISPPRIYMVDGEFADLEPRDPIDLTFLGKFHEEYKLGIVDHRGRNKMLAWIGNKLAERGVPTLCLLQRKDQGKLLERLIEGSEFLYGASEVSERNRAKKRLASGKLPVVIATTIFDEGEDVPAIGAMMLAGGYKAEHLAIQRVGRGLRPSEGKDFVFVFDCWDGHSQRLERHSKSRRAAFERAGFEVRHITFDKLKEEMTGAGFWK